MNFVKQLITFIKTLFNPESKSPQPQRLFSEETNPEKSGDPSDDNDKGRSLTEPPSVASVKIIPSPNG